MPIYAYRCQDCATLYEERRGFEQADDPSVCPQCESHRAERLISVPVFIRGGSGLGFAGGGCACSTGGTCACKASPN